MIHHAPTLRAGMMAYYLCVYLQPQGQGYPTYMCHLKTVEGFQLILRHVECSYSIITFLAPYKYPLVQHIYAGVCACCGCGFLLVFTSRLNLFVCP